MRSARVPAAVLSAALAALTAPAQLADRVAADGSRDDIEARTFVFVASEPALPFVHRSGRTGEDKRFMIECVGPGLGLVDVEDDGDLDLYLVQGGGITGEGVPVTGPESRDALFLNDGAARFTNAGEAAGELSAGFGFGVTAADVDGDGDEDLLVTNLGPNDLLLNDGAGRLALAPGAAGLAGEPGDWSMGAAFGDVELDGDLDVYVTNYLAHDLDHPMLSGRPCRWLGCEVPCGPAGLDAQPDRFYTNDGDGRFTEATSRAGLDAIEPRYAFQPVFVDLDDDGDLDLFVANDSVPNGCFVNEGPDAGGGPRFVEQGLRSGLALSSSGKDQAGMGVAVGDVSGDGLPDLVMTNFSREANALFVNASGPHGVLFFDEAGRSGLGRPSFLDLGWGANLMDADLDGDLDLFVANGHVYPQVDECELTSMTFRQRDRFYEQTGPVRFRPVDEAGPALAVAEASRGSAAGDLDGDGDLDLVVGVLDGRPAVVLNETPRRGQWVQLDLRPLADAVGARVALIDGRRRRVAHQVAGSSFLCAEDRRLHFGVSTEGALAAEVRWPGGAVERFDAVARDAVTVLHRGEGRTP